MAQPATTVINYGSKNNSGGIQIGGSKTGVTYTGKAVTVKSAAKEEEKGDGDGKLMVSQSYVVSAMQDGALSTKQDREMNATITRLMKSAVDAAIDSVEEIRVAVKTFEEMSKTFNQKYTTVALKLADKLVEGGDLGTLVERTNTLEQIAKQVGDRYYTTLHQSLTIRKLASEHRLGEYKGVVDLVFHARVQELNLLTQRLGVLHKQEDHNLQLMVAIQNQQLKFEEAKLDMALKKAKFESSEDQRKCDNEIASREQSRKENKDILDQQLKDAERKDKKELEKLRAENDKAIEDYRIKSEKEVQSEKIQSEERVQICGIAAEMVKPNCVIQ